MAVPKRKLVLWILSVLNVCSFMFFAGIHGDVPDDVVYTELHKDVRIRDSAVLTCQFRGSPLAVYWKKGEDPRRSPNLISWISTDDDTGKCQLESVCDIMEMNENYSLVIKEVSISEQARYICRVSNYKGNTINNFTDVSVYAPPKEPYPIIDGCINRNSSGSNPELCRISTNNSTITLTCSVTNYYPQIELFFLHGSKKMTTINPVQQNNADLTKNRSISIEARVSETPYTCVASDVPGSLTEQKAATILVEPMTSPTTETIKKQSLAVKIGVPLILSAIAAGVFLWWKRNRGHREGLNRYVTAKREEDNTLRERPFMAANAGVTEQGDFSGIVKTLGLDKYYPSKISLLDAMVIKKFTRQHKLVDLPWMIIYKLLMIDFNARYQLSAMVNKSSRGEMSEDRDEFGFHSPLLEMQSTGGCEDNATHLNTLDVMVAIFICCDNFLKQTLAQKLFVCKLAIPFLYPLGTEGNIGMSLWALRMIIVQRHTKDKEAPEMTVTGNPFPVVTFVRLGRPPLSKSKLVNDILRDDSHDTFFHKDCINGTVPRRITDGLVECSWFIKVGKKNDHLPNTTTILNLRGDASLMKKQMQILQEISSVIFVTASAIDLTIKKNTNTLKKILRKGGKIILLLISGKNNHNTQEIHVELQTCFQAVGRELLKDVSIILSSTRQGIHKNASELKTEARAKLSEVISGCSGTVVENFAEYAREKGIIIDEYDDEACLEGKVLAENVISHMKDVPIVDCKCILLPLQCAGWTEYCKLLKSQHRMGGQVSQSTLAYHEEVKQNLYGVRKLQVELYQSRLTPFIKEFMSTLRKDTDSTMYFLKWMDLLLNEISRANLPGLRRQYYNAWAEFEHAKKKQEMANLKAQVDDAESRLARASFGLKNLFRELGQIYEAVMGCGNVGQDTRADVEILPEIAAKLLLKGSPLELVDGNTSSVPITWVTAVLRKLGNIIGEKRLFVLSVLGIQSSGKSTLLNTMFGLQFAVSAGRCTRGAYMQLIPVEENSDLPFDYVVVVDTEGLRAPELRQLMYEHDNELATLVIGLGDVTMINIKGENTAVMKDILQIAVHAFLRMNLVSKLLRDHRTCLFVHQNVPSANAEELMMHGCQKLVEILDEMTKEAAFNENIANVHSFSQIISFGVQNHVWYFPDLWHGNPPMAPANPGYSEKVGAVRLYLLEEIAKGQTTFLTSSDLSTRLEDIWNGVLADDFVFSFRNSLEVKAYNSLQSKYYTLEWELQNSMKSWLQGFAECKLEICESIDDLERSLQSLIIKLSKVLTDKAEKAKYCLEDYFKNCNLRDIIIQWQQSKLNQLNFAVEQQQYEGEADLRSIKEARQVEIMQSQKWSKHEAYIMKKAVELGEEMIGKEVTDPEQEKRFNTMWLSMVCELAPHTEDKILQMDLVMEGILFQRFHAHRALLRDELRHHSLKNPLKQKSLESSITLDDVRQEHVTLKTSLLKNIETLADENSRELEAARWMTLMLTIRILVEIDTYLNGLSNQDMKFLKTHAARVVKILVEKIETFNQNADVSNDYNFTIIPGYAVKLAVHVSRHCVQVFSSIQLKYNNQLGAKAKLAVYKNTAWSLFKNKVKQSTEEAMAGDLLCTHLKGVVQKAVKKAIPRKCIDEVLRDFQMTKYYLVIKILEDLAENGNLKEYKAYINNAKCFALTWITKYTNEKMFSRQGVNDKSRYAEIANSGITRIIQCITKSVENATAEVEGQRDRRMDLWIEKFCQSASEEIVVPVSTLTFVKHRSVVNFKNLERIILDQLNRIRGSMEEAFASETKHSVVWDGTPPAQQILDKIWGCPEQCPFCHSPCVDNTPRHFSSYGRRHTCVQHRPRGLLGVRIFAGMKTGKNQLLNQTCNYSIQGKDLVFGCDACDFKCRDSGKCSATGMNIVYHKYTEYKTYIPEWDIAPDSTNSMSKYWMWVMANYKLYRDSFAQVPQSWRSITKEEALADLKIIHH